MSEQALRALLVTILITVLAAGLVVVGVLTAVEWWSSQREEYERDLAELAALESSIGDVDALEARVEEARQLSRPQTSGSEPPTLLEVSRVVTDLADRHAVRLTRVTPDETREQRFVEFEGSGTPQRILRIVEAMYVSYPSYEPSMLTISSGGSEARLVLRVAHE